MDGTNDSQGLIATIMTVVMTLLAIYQRFQTASARKDAGKLDSALRLVVIGAEEMAKFLPKEVAKETKGAIRAYAEKEGVEDILHQVVVETTKGAPASLADRPPAGPGPKFGALLGFALLLALAPASGCVARESKETAKQLYKSADRLWRGSMPRGFEPANQAAYWVEWKRFRELSRDLVLAHGEELPALEGEEPAR